MDGRNRRVILSENLYWVNGLTADLPAERLFYADARLDYIASCDYEGRNVQVMEIIALVSLRTYYCTLGSDSNRNFQLIPGLSLFAFAGMCICVYVYTCVNLCVKPSL